MPKNKTKSAMPTHVPTSQKRDSAALETATSQLPLLFDVGIAPIHHQEEAQPSKPAGGRTGGVGGVAAHGQGTTAGEGGKGEEKASDQAGMGSIRGLLTSASRECQPRGPGMRRPHPGRPSRSSLPVASTHGHVTRKGRAQGRDCARCASL